MRKEIKVDKGEYSPWGSLNYQKRTFRETLRKVRSGIMNFKDAEETILQIFGLPTDLMTKTDDRGAMSDAEIEEMARLWLELFGLAGGTIVHGALSDCDDGRDSRSKKPWWMFW